MDEDPGVPLPVQFCATHGFNLLVDRTEHVNESQAAKSCHSTYFYKRGCKLAVTRPECIFHECLQTTTSVIIGTLTFADLCKHHWADIPFETPEAIARRARKEEERDEGFRYWEDGSGDNEATRWKIRSLARQSPYRKLM